MSQNTLQLLKLLRKLHGCKTLLVIWESFQLPVNPIEIFCDNTGVVAFTKEPKDHGKTKHIKRKFHYVRHRVEDGDILVSRISSEENPVDPFTKALSKTKHELHVRSIGLRQDISFSS